MRLSFITTTAALAMATPIVTASHQWIVISTSGQIVDVDPSPYMPESRRLRKLREQEEREADEKHKNTIQQLHTDKMHRTTEEAQQAMTNTIDDGFFDDDEEEHLHVQANDTKSDVSTDPMIPDIETMVLDRESVRDDAWHDDFMDDEEMSVAAEESGDDAFGSEAALSPSSLMTLLTALEDESSFPAVQGSVVFAELSCLFVAFIAYLIHSVPLWSGFSLGQRCCMFVAFSAAFLYQFVAIGYYYDAVSPDVALSISSLITRTISLGMVPITTTSFIGRARTSAELAATQDKPPSQSTLRTKPSRHRKARSS